MKRYVVTNTILSRAEGATPADVTYYRGESHVQALAALVSAATMADRIEDSTLPESMRFDVTSTRLDMYREAVDATPSIKPLSFDNETNDYSLSDCVWWVEPVSKRPWWARGDCSGRVGDTARGVLCEHHYNEGSKA